MDITKNSNRSTFGATTSPASAPSKSSSVSTAAKNSTSQEAPVLTAKALSNELGSTLEAFNSRMRQRKLEREIRDGESEKAAKIRHALMLEAMTTLRRSLQDVSRIDLGDRFSFSLDADDWGGWPRLQLRLEDSLFPQNDYPMFQIVAHDRNQQGAIEISYGLNKQSEKVSIQQSENLKQLPKALKRCVRIYLDIIEKTICDAELREVEELERRNLVEVESELSEDTDTKDRITGDLFEDDLFEADFLERLPEIEELDNLPDYALDSSE